MSNSAWRTVIIRNGDHLSCSSGIMTVKSENSTYQLAISEIQSCIIENFRTSITIPLLYEMMASGISIILCDSKHTPFAEVVGNSTHHESAGHLMDQANWSEEKKRTVWDHILMDKFSMQWELLSIMHKSIPKSLGQLPNLKENGMLSENEGTIAKQYFRALFGWRFRRHSTDNINAMLDYGYAILRSTIDRILFAHGYHTALGIHHCSRNNRFNLSCDLMEPFRPFIDRAVFESETNGLGTAEKNMLANIMYSKCKYRGQTLQLQDAITQYTLEMLSILNGENIKKGVLCFA